MKALRSLLLVSAGAIALSAAGLAQVSTDVSKATVQAEAAYDRADYAEAVRWYRLAADQGYAKAQYNLGTMYDNGEGVPQNYAEAVRWYRLAADQGYAKAQYNLGVAYRDGEGVQQNHAEAARWYRLAADQGLAPAQYNLGNTYANGEGVPQNYAEAVRWYRLAADQGDAMAQSNMGAAYADGTGVPQNYAEAVRWYQLAADQGDAKAQSNMGFMYDKGEGVPQNYAEALRWYRLAADQGYAGAQYNLGVMYANGRGATQNYAEAVRWYRLAADQGDAGAQTNLGVMFDNAEGVPENDVEAVKWYRLAADQDFAAAQAGLGRMYDKGEGVPQNYAEALRWYQLAATQGDAVAQNNLGVMYTDGTGVPENYVEAYKWWSLAAAQGDGMAARNRDIVRGRMTPAQIAEGQRLAAAWKPFASTEAELTASPETPPPATEGDSTGSGFFITAAGHILTNAHVVEGCSRVSLAGSSTLTVLDIDLGSDLALLKKSGTSVTAPLMLRQGRGVRLADNVVVAGFPLSGLLSSGLNVTTGAVSALAGPGDDRRLIQITAPVQPGNSGGPLLDSSGNVVGVVVSKLDALKVASITGDIPQNVNFAISLGTLQAFLDANGVDYVTRTSSAPKSNADVADIARAATVQIECRN